MAKGWLFLGRNKQSKTEAVNVDNGALEVKTVGNIGAQLKGSDVAIPMDMQYHSIEDSNPVPVKGAIGIDQTTQGESNGVTLNGRSDLVTVIPATLRPAGAYTEYVIPPKWAKMAIVRMYIANRSGSFTTDQGARLTSHIGAIPGSSRIGCYVPFRVRTPWSSTQFTEHAHLWCAGANTNPFEVPGNNTYAMKIVPVIPQPGVRVDLEIAGTFDAGQGVTAQVDISWIGW